MLFTNLALALAPSLLLLWWAYRRDSIKKESIRLLLLTFSLGLLAVVPALVLGILVDPFRDFFRGYARIVFQAFVVAALVEEAVKFVLLDGLIRRQPEFDEVTDGIVYGMAVSLGFAFLENVLYVGGPSHVLLLRAVTAVPLHAGCGALVGYYVGRAAFDARARSVGGLLLAIAVHGVYNVLLFTGGIASFLSLGVILGLVIAVPLLFKKAIALDIAAGRATVIPKPFSNP
ncbi:MAG: PrsW family intramembrane metalloprotease [Spirochaetota bacterium]